MELIPSCVQLMGNTSSDPYEDGPPHRGDLNEERSRLTTGSQSRRTPVIQDDHDEAEYADTAGLYNVDDASEDDALHHTSCCQKFLTRLKRVIFAENWLFLIVLGLVTAIVGFGIDAGIYYLFMAETKLSALAPHWIGQYMIWIVWSLVFAVLAILPVILISPYASGSGIPEMKCILSGIELNRYLNFRTLVSKCSGLVLAYASGLSIGKEGPFVHISSILCSLLTKLPFFKYIRVNNAAYMQVLGAATASGVTAAFGTPVGGVFFSMEVTSTFYHVENLWRAFFVSIAAKLLSTVLQQFVPFGLDLFDVNSGQVSWSLVELVPFAVLGILFGVLSGAFVRLLTLVFRLSRIHDFLQTAWGQLLRAAAVCFVIALVAFPLKLMRNDTDALMSYLSTDDPGQPEWVTLSLVCLAKFVLTMFSVAFTGAAAGVFGPVFVQGALMGRLFGEIVVLLFPSLNASPVAYSIVGAAAFASGVTRTLSTALIAVELTLQAHLMLPVLLAVLLANFFGRMLSLSVYSVLIQAKDLPQMPRFKLFSQATSKTAGEIMRTDVHYLHTTSTFGECLALVSKSDFPSFPLVDAEGFFCGTVRRAKLSSALKHAGLKLRSVDLGSLGARVLDRAIKQWDAKNHPYDRSSPIPVTHLEPEDLEEGLGRKNMSSSLENQIPASPLEDAPGTFGRKASMQRMVTIPAASSSRHEDDFAPPQKHMDEPEVEVAKPVEADAEDSMMKTPVPFVFSFAATEKHVVEVDTSVMTISPDATVTKVHFIFTVLGLSHIFVVRRGKLMGIITRQDLIKSIQAMNLQKR